MNQSALERFAQDARRDLLKQVELRLNYWIGAEGAKAAVDSAEHRQFAPQIKELAAACKSEGREALVERVAYTWFNRFAALRFMDANGYHPFGARVIMPPTANETLPELLQQARAGVLDADVRACLGNARTFDDLLAGRLRVEQPDGAVYRLLLVAVCNYYHRFMPFMFEKIGDATELLLPQDLLTEHSTVHAFRTDLADDDCHDVEVIGWLYQHYISEKKGTVMARKTAVPKEDIPAVTQLFTPHWIVRYLVENSLGRLWLLNRPGSRLRAKMPYYIDPSSPEATKGKGGEAEVDFLKIAKPEDIRLLDPACGSGHMLTYAYDLLYAIYAEEGYDAPDIPGLILQHNLYGVEICDRAAALAAFALFMKARATAPRFFRRLLVGSGVPFRSNVISLQDVRFADEELAEYIRALNVSDLFDAPAITFLHQFAEAKNFGSLLQLCLDTKTIAEMRRRLDTMDLGEQLFVRKTHSKVLQVFEQAEALTQRYHIVVANPPYMGSGQMDSRTKTWAETFFSKSKADLYSMFIERSRTLVIPQGFAALVTMESWLFLSSFNLLRLEVLNGQTLHSMIHMPYLGRGGTSMGINFGTAAAVWQMSKPVGGKAQFYCLRYYETDADGHPLLFPPHNERTASTDPSLFLKVQNVPFVYWLKNFDVFDWPRLSTVWKSGGRLKTHDGPRFIRYRWETSRSSTRWRALVKGGDFRKHAGNEEFLVDWSEGAVAYYQDRGGLYPVKFRNREGICWSKITSAISSFRIKPPDCEFDSASPTIFNRSFTCDFVLLAFLNSVVARYLLQAVNPTLNTQLVDVLGLPFRELDSATTDVIWGSEVCAVQMARADWDGFETSRGFREQPLLWPKLKGATLAASWQTWRTQCDAAIRRMWDLETENNRLFIAAYGLQEELKPEVPEEQITLARPDARKDMAAFVSYAVGCMFGRYSLDASGLILADAGSTVADYYRILAERSAATDAPATGRRGDGANASAIAHAPPRQFPLSSFPPSLFPPDPDGILPVLDGEWFADDIVGRFREFLKVTFGEATFDENLAFVEASLGKDLRKYFVRDFYKNHLSNERAFGYKKRPIYWMFSSPSGSFQALIYLHRYTRDTANLVLNDYLREFLHKLEERQRQLTATRLNESARAGDRAAAVKELGRIEKMLRELKAWERDVMLPLAQQRIEIDLDDGVKVNYLKFRGALVPIPGLEKKEEE